jgi:hypothetical protein
MDAVWLLLAIATCAGILVWMYRQTDHPRRDKGLVLVVGWLVVTAPMAYFRLDANVPVAASSAVVGLVVFAAVSRGRFDTVINHFEQASSDDDSTEQIASVSDWLFVLTPIALLSLLIFWPF